MTTSDTSTNKTYNTPSGKQVTLDASGNPVSAPSNTPEGRYPTGYVAPGTGDSTQKSSEQTQEDKTYAGTKAEDPAVIAKRINDEYAAELQSIRNYYAGITSQQVEANKTSSGKTRALVSASGELGQDIGSAQQDETETQNREKLATIGREEQVKEAGVRSTIASTTESEIQSEKATEQAGETAHLSFLSAEAQKAQSQIATVAGTSDLANIPQNEYDSLYEASGFATPEQFNTYYNAVRQSALTGGKTIGDATTGVYQQQSDGSWKNVIKGSKDTLGDPTAGVWQKQDDGTYKNIIPAQPKIGSIGAAGSYVFDPTTKTVKTIKPAAPKIVSSGGVIYSVDQNTQKATQLTKSIDGWSGAKGAAGDQEKAAILSYIHGKTLGLSDADAKALTEAVQTNPKAYYNALANAAQAGIFVPITISPDSAGQMENTDASTNAGIDSGTTDVAQ